MMHPRILLSKLIMRKTTFLLYLLFSLSASAGSRAQDITITLDALDLKKAIVETERKTVLRFLYNESIIPVGRKVSVEARNMPVPEFLDRLFTGTGIQYRVMDNNLIVLTTQRANDTQTADRTISGRVRDESGQPISGVSVTVKGTQSGTVTDANGLFSLTVPDDAVLTFSAVGYQSIDIPVSGRTDFSISLIQAVKMQDQVVVIGYGTARRKDLTGSSVTIKGSEIANIPVLTATQAIQGRAAGVQVVSSGAPGSAPNVRIRGTGSILGGVEPLYVVDGIITSDIRNINTADILTVDVLKDASSTAIYGARASNGVVLITTRAGSGGKLRVKYDGQVGARLLTHGVEMSGPNLFAIYSNEAAGGPAIASADITGSTYWYEELTRPAPFTNHNISLSGGKKRYKFYGSAGYMLDNGILLDNKFQRFTARYNHEFAVNSKLKFGNNIGYSHYISDNKPYSLFTTAYIAAPIFEPYNPDGTFGNTTKSDVGNPIATLKNTNNRSWGDRLQFLLWGEYKILKNLSFRSNFGIDLEKNNGWDYTPVYSTYTPFGVQAGQRNERSSLFYGEDSLYHWTWDNVFTYDLKAGDKHVFKFVAGHTAERRDGWRSTATRFNVPNDKNQWQLDFTDTSGGQQNVRLPANTYFRRESFFLRTNYTLMDRYLVNLTLRRDASSNFPESKRWATFPSIGLGWVISDEAFLANSKTINVLKLRTSYGLLGNDAIPPGQFFLQPTERLWANWGTTRVDGATVLGIKDPNLQWEVAKVFDIGVEFAMLNSRLTGEIDFYNKLATRALYTIPLPSVGFGNTLLTNAADVLNRGVEISLGWSESLKKDFRYNVRGNITFNHNEVKNIGLGKALYDGSLNNGFLATITDVGLPIGSFYVYRTNGIFQTIDEVNAGPHLPNAQPGDFRIVDTNGDKVIDDNDRQAVGSAQPKFFYGINGSVNWRRWDFALELYGSGGNYVYNAKKGVRYGGNYNIEYEVAQNRWLPGSGRNDFPRAFNGTAVPSDYFVEKADFLRVNNITVGYSFNATKWKLIDRLRVYASAQNPIIFTSYTGFTPEMPGSPLASGIELNIYPISAIYLVGVNLQFR
jgi:TonB-linked SusC/RagA family outer membrane protein